jgi:predicted Zn-dependent peptidase
MYQKTTLDNQLRVITATMPHTQSVSMVFSVGAGSRYEAKEFAGISHFIEHLPFKGTRNWPTARQVSEAIEGVGGVMNASTDREMTVFWCTVPKPYFRQAFAVLLDMVLNPLLDPLEVEKEREVIQEELRMTYDDPTYRVELLIDELLWPDQAMGRDVGGTPETVGSISLDSIHNYMQLQYNPANVVVSVAGGVFHDEVVDIVQAATRHWCPVDGLEWEPMQNCRYEPLVQVGQRRTDQTHICLALPGIALGDSDRYALAILNVILGDGMSSRLFLNLRERQGLAYDIHSSISHFHDCGSLVIYCGVEPKKAQEAVKSAVNELEGMLREVPNQELDKAKEYTKGRLLLRMEDGCAVALWMGAQELLLRQVATVDQVSDRVNDVTAKDVVRVANRIIKEEQLTLAVVGPHRGFKSFRELLKF